MARLGGTLLVLLAAAQLGSAMHSQGSINLPTNSTVFIGKFCFTFNTEAHGSAGKLNITVRAPSLARHQAVHVLMFDDEAESYPGPSGQWDALTCAQRMQHAKKKIRLSWAKRETGQLIKFNIEEHLRPRFWYIALADCSGQGLDQVSFEFEALNGAYGWAREFSTDKHFAPLAFLVLAAVYGALAAAQRRANAILAASEKGDSARDKAAHPFARILTAGIILGFAACSLSTCHFLLYAANGMGAPLILMGAQILSGASRFVLASLLLLVSEGKCISYVMTAADARRVARLLGPFLAACLLLELWGDHSVSRRYTTDYVYTTAFGWAIILVDLLLLSMYAVTLRRTHEAERDNSDGVFYRSWGVLYGTWFLAMPIAAILSQLVLAPYVWYIISVCVTGAADALVYAALVVGLWPGNVSTYFKLNSPPLLEDAFERFQAPLSGSRGPDGSSLPTLLRSVTRTWQVHNPSQCKKGATRGDVGLV